MHLTGKQLIGVGLSGVGDYTFAAINPGNQEQLEPAFHEAQPDEIARAAELAQAAFDEYRALPATRRAEFLRHIANEIEALGDTLIDRAHAETAVGKIQLQGERARTTGQLRIFAELIEEGSWVDARIDTPLPGRNPVPRPDLRRMLIPLGPVAVFGASNFPLAFSVAGGDTASALAAGCPVVVKAHPAHPGTSELVGQALLRAAQAKGMPEGVFSMLHGPSPETGQALVKHPAIKAVGFTGSLRGGRAIFDTAATRPDPIPVYAEMGSINPVFVLPGAAARRRQEIADGLHQSFTLGAGQFCTNPGLVLALAADAERLVHDLTERIKGSGPSIMLYQDLANAYRVGVETRAAVQGVRLDGWSASGNGCEAYPAVLSTQVATFLTYPELADELFGSVTLVVACDSREQLLTVAERLEGHLTATVQGEAGELAEYRDLIAVLERKVGRLLFNGFPTGVEVSPSMQHGGPYPATTDSRTTSVGTAAIERFARPICYQNFPDAALPKELCEGNPLGIWRLVDGRWTREG